MESCQPGFEIQSTSAVTTMKWCQPGFEMDRKYDVNQYKLEVKSCQPGFETNRKKETDRKKDVNFKLEANIHSRLVQ